MEMTMEFPWEMFSLFVLLSLTSCAFLPYIFCGSKKKRKKKKGRKETKRRPKGKKKKPRKRDSSSSSTSSSSLSAARDASTTDLHASVNRPVRPGGGGARMGAASKPNAQPYVPVGSPKPHAPDEAARGVADSHDPNYQTLAVVGGDVFGSANNAGDGGGGGYGGGGAGCNGGGGGLGGGAGGGGAPLPEVKVPTVGGLVGAADPNYQTLAAVADNIFDADNGIGATGGAQNQNQQQEPHKIPEKKDLVGAADPNYQTLAVVKGDIFE